MTPTTRYSELGNVRIRLCVCLIYMCGQPCVPTDPCTARGLDSTLGLWLTVAWRMQPRKGGRSACAAGTVTPSGGQTGAP